MLRIAICFLLLIPSLLQSMTYYASPNGRGDGYSISSPFRIKDFWRIAQPGDYLLLLDGKYTGSHSMITPPNSLSGVSGNPITVRAFNDGKVEINGEGSRSPVRLFDNDYWVIEGINAHSAKSTVVCLIQSNHNVIRRVCAWDTGEGNHNIFAAHRGESNLFEDCAGWGLARKIFSNSMQGNYTTYRRCWGRWEGSHVVGPKMTYSCCYNSHHITMENCIGTWDGRKMKETYVLLDYEGNPFTGAAGGIYTNYEVQEPYGVFSLDGIRSGDNKAYIKLLGCIAYLKDTQRYHHMGERGLFFMTHMDYGFMKAHHTNEIEIKDAISYVAPGQYSFVSTFTLEFGPYSNSMNNRAENLTSIGSAGPYFNELWGIENLLQSNDGTELTSNGNHILDPTLNGLKIGARVMKRYVDGQLTNKDLWPWPMNQRIIDAMTLGGCTDPVDVTKTLFETLAKERL